MSAIPVVNRTIEVERLRTPLAVFVSILSINLLTNAWTSDLDPD